MSEIGQKLIAAIREAASKNPDKANAENCQYFGTIKEDDGYDDQYVRLTGSGDCIVGCAFVEVGLFKPEEGELPPSWNEESFPHIQSLVKYNGKPLAELLDYEEETWIGNAQVYQDAHYPWGLAIEKTDELGTDEKISHGDVLDYSKVKAVQNVGS